MNSIDKLFLSEGGRLERELQYVEKHLGAGAGATNQMLIQTPKDAEAKLTTVLTPEALLSHAKVIRAASRVVVERDDT